MEKARRIASSSSKTLERLKRLDKKIEQRKEPPSPPVDHAALSLSFFKRGERCLLDGDLSGLHFFDMAVKFDPENCDLFLNQGLALFEYGSGNEKEAGLSLAAKSFRKALSINPNCFEAWHAFGNTLYLLGMRTGEPTYFNHAKGKYEKALALIANQTQDVIADLYWDLADVWSRLAERSGEAADLNSAIKFYEKAKQCQTSSPSEFWLSFGDAYRALGGKMNDLNLLVEAINCYKNGVSISISSHVAWLKLANILKELYSYTHDEDHYSQANECYLASSQLYPNNAQLWLNWADFLLESGKHFWDIKRLHSCIEKCRRGHTCDPKNTHLITIWSEALAYLGFFSEKLKFFNKAQEKVEPLYEADLKETRLYHAYGTCLFLLGKYFKDIDYIYQSIEKFQEGLSLNRSIDYLWFDIALAYVTAAELDRDKQNFKHACRFFKQALYFKVNSVYHYHFGYCYLRYSELVHSQLFVEKALHHFEKALDMQKTASYQRPEWLFHYAIALDYLGEYSESELSYLKALDVLNQVLILSPDFPQIHAQMALTLSHYAELLNELEIYQKAFHHYRISHQKDREDDQNLLDWGITLVNFAERLEDRTERTQCYKEAEYKMIQAAKLGNSHAYFSLACIYSLISNYSRSIYFLEKAHAFETLPSLEEILEEDWLEGVRTTELFEDFIEKIKSPVQE